MNNILSTATQRIIAILVLIFVNVFVFVNQAAGQAPKTLTYQGKLSDGSGPLNGSYSVAFNIYDAATGGNSLWTETHNVSVTGGNLSLVLGKTTAISFPISKPMWLGIIVGSDPEISPRVELTGSLYSLGIAFPIAATTEGPAPAIQLDGIGDAGPTVQFSITNPLNSSAAINGVTVGTGSAGYFGIDNTESSGNALHATTNGNGNSFYALNEAGGSAGYFQISNPANTAPLLNLNHAGTGNAISANRPIQATQFIGDGSQLTNVAITANSVGTIQVTDNSLTDADISATAAISGSKISPHFGSQNIMTGGTVSASPTGDGPIAGDFTIDGNNGNYAIRARAFGPGNAAHFESWSRTGSSPTMFSMTEGLGSAGLFRIQNASSTSAALRIEHSGPGNAITANRPIQATQFIGDGSLLTNLPASSLALPYNVGVTTATTAFSVTQNDNANAAAQFGIASGASTAFYAVGITAAGTARGLYVANVGTGIGGDFRVLNNTSTNAAVNGFTVGTGPAGAFQITNTGSSSSAVTASTSGTGAAGGFSSSGNGVAGAFQAMGGGRAISGLINSNTNSSTALDIQNFGLGRSAFFSTSNTANNAPVIEGVTTGIGPVQRLNVSNSSSTAPALNISHNGTGNAITANRPIQATQFIGDGSLLTNLPGGFSSSNMVPRGNGSALALSSIKDDGVNAAFGQAGISAAAQVSILTDNKYALSASNNSTSSPAGYFSNSAYGTGGHALQAFGLSYFQANAGSGGTANRAALMAVNSNDAVASNVPMTGTTGGRFVSTSNSVENKYGLVAGSNGASGQKFGVYALAEGAGTNYGIFAQATGGTNNYAGAFQGNVTVSGSLTKGSGTFKIDHPADPENKFLYHSFVESPDMMNVYNGNIVTNEKGIAEVELPEYFESLNKDFRYQLTVIGEFADAIIGKKISNNTFTIRTDKPNVEVSWQITGIRKDPYAERNRVVPEVEKNADEKGKYLHPEAYGLPKERGLDTNVMKNN